MEVRVTAVNYLIESKNSEDSSIIDKKLTLNNINLNLKSGSITSIFGTEKGHIQLLECIAFQSEENGFMSGHIHYESAVGRTTSLKDIVFVRDTGVFHFDALSIYDYLYYAACLRMSHGAAECKERARVITKLLHLNDKSKLGDLSAGERRLLVIGAELIGYPQLVCLQDPLNGLDASEALDVLRFLRRLSSRQSSPTTVLFNTNGLNTDMLRNIDCVALFTGAKLYRVLPLSTYDPTSRTRVCEILRDMSVYFLDAAYRTEVSVSTSNKSSRALLRRQDRAQDHSEFLEHVILKHCRDIDEAVTPDLQHPAAISTSPAVTSNMLFSAYSRKPVVEISGSRINSMDVGGGGWQSHTPLNDSSTRPVRMPSESGWFQLSDGPYTPAESPAENRRSLKKVVQPHTKVSSQRPYVSTRHRLLDMGLADRTFKPWHKEILLLCTRAIKQQLYSYKQLGMSTFRFIIAGLVLGILAVPNGDISSLSADDLAMDTDGLVNSEAYDVTSALFAVVALSLIGTSYTIPYLHSHTRTLRLEVAAGHHRALSGWLSVICVDLTLFVVAAVGVGSILFFFLQLRGAHFYFSTVVTGTLCGYSLAAVFSVWQNDWQRAMLYFSCFEVVGIVFCGYLRPISSLPPWWAWLSNIVFTRWAFETLMYSVFTGLPDGANYLKMYGFSLSDGSGSTYAWLVLWLVLLQALLCMGIVPWKDFKHTIGIGSSKSSDDNDIRSYDDSQLQSTYNPLVKLAQNVEYCNSAASIEDPEVTRNTISNRLQAALVMRDPDENFRVPPISQTSHISLTWQDLHLEMARSTGREIIFRGVYGHADPGDLVCLMDGAGLGAADVLLRVLAGRKHAPGRLTGSVEVNGEGLRSGFVCRNMVYVERGDLPLSPVTVRDSLTFSAQLRHSAHHPCQSRGKSTADGYAAYQDDAADSEPGGRFNRVDDLVNEVMLATGLMDICDARCCDRDGICMLTPSQLRCLTIATELVRRPALLFLEDPLHGLQWHDAEAVTALLKALAKGGRTVICSLNHPPARSVHDRFDSSLLLSSSYMIYFGSSINLVSYFENIGFERGEFHTDLQFVLDVAADVAAKKFNPAPGRNTSMTLTVQDLADLCLQSLLAEGTPAASSRPSPTASGSYSWVKNAVGAKELQLTPRKAVGDNQIQNQLEADQLAVPVYEDDEQSVGSRMSNLSNGPGVQLNGNSNKERQEQNKGQPTNPATIIKVDSQPSRVTRKSRVLLSRANTGEDVGQSRLFLVRRKRGTPILPAAWVVLRRNINTSLADVPWVVVRLIAIALVGLLIGSVWSRIGTGDYLDRVSLFATTYFCVTCAVVYNFTDMHRRRRIFLRESTAEACLPMSYWLVDGLTTQWVSFVAGFLFTVPLYFISALRSGAGYYMCFYGLAIASLYCNLSFCQLLISLPQLSESTSQMLFTGVVVPLQLVFSGFLFLVPAMQPWYRWGSLLCPPSYFIAGAFQNEFDGNPNALGSVSYESLAGLYGFTLNKWKCFAVLMVLGVVTQLLWLLLLTVLEMQRRKLLVARVSDVSVRAKSIIERAGKRLRGKRESHRGGATSSIATEDSVDSRSLHNAGVNASNNSPQEKVQTDFQPNNLEAGLLSTQHGKLSVSQQKSPYVSLRDSQAVSLSRAYLSNDRSSKATGVNPIAGDEVRLNGELGQPVGTNGAGIVRDPGTNEVAAAKPIRETKSHWNFTSRSDSDDYYTPLN